VASPTFRNKGISLSDTEEQLQKLEDRVLKAFELIKQYQAEKLSLRQEIERLKADCRENNQETEARERELVALRREREDVRMRVEKLLERLDALTPADVSG
jgi:chromosome segregation ATPase